MKKEKTSTYREEEKFLQSQHGRFLTEDYSLFLSLSAYIYIYIKTLLET